MLFFRNKRKGRFENTVDIAKEFPSIVEPSNEPIFGNLDTKSLDTNKVGSLYVS
tara:strand:- start:316 stop:477 length:162 start_codon:yes stop_codon:yes gene_type:complete